MRKRLFAALISAGLAAASFQWTVPREEHFLLSARVLVEDGAGKGITKSLKATLTDGRHTHDAHIQTVNIYMPLFKGKDGSEEKDFKDSWKFNVAAWRLAKLLRLTNMTPTSVARRVDGKPASVTWWLDDVLMDEKERLAKGIKPPDAAAWAAQMDTVRIFDQLIYNMDRSQENLLITKDWHAWMIDHTRAFRKAHTLRNPAAVVRCNPALLSALKDLRRGPLEREMSGLLTAEEIEGLLARCDLIVEKLTGEAPAPGTAPQTPPAARTTSRSRERLPRHRE